jgi:hypothetical protein
MYRLNASVDFTTTASESLLSDGLRLSMDDVVWTIPRGKAEGQRVLGETSRGDRETCEPFFNSMLGLLAAQLWLLSVGVNSELVVFLFSITSPPAMTTGAILSIRNGS